MSIRKVGLILVLAMFFMALLVGSVYGQTIYLPSVGKAKAETTVRPCGNPCALSTPYPALTATPDIGEPPMPVGGR